MGVRLAVHPVSVAIRRVPTRVNSALAVVVCSTCRMPRRPTASRHLYMSRAYLRVPTRLLPRRGSTGCARTGADEIQAPGTRTPARGMQFDTSQRSACAQPPGSSSCCCRPRTELAKGGISACAYITCTRRSCGFRPAQRCPTIRPSVCWAHGAQSRCLCAPSRSTSDYHWLRVLGGAIARRRQVLSQQKGHTWAADERLLYYFNGLVLYAGLPPGVLAALLSAPAAGVVSAEGTYQRQTTPPEQMP